MKMQGRFCERTETPKGFFDRRSFRWKRSGRAWVLVGCERGEWAPRRGRCKVGLRAHKLLVSSKTRCRSGQKAITKGRRR